MFKSHGGRRFLFGFGCFTAGWMLAAPFEWLARSHYGLALGLGVGALVAAWLVIAWAADRKLWDRAVRNAIGIADGPDVSDWQRGYRACADRALYALGDRRRPNATRKCPACTADVDEPHSPICQQPAERRDRV